ncbi:3-dehydroquinate synthase [Bacteroidia bacterium]|nr:3-dehydroquinate synthase [Bacteroidia bacterium]GHV23905.1 3-dehydroquinate synthase [Bacteroidia bacterium]
MEFCLRTIEHDRLFVLVDENTQQGCLPLLQETGLIENAGLIVIPSGEINKSIDTLTKVWTYLSRHEATRKSLLLNLGGGLLTDLGGFAAATFKRGMHFVNIPTTLLSMVDAAVGGKTGINFLGLKNEIGAFAPADVVLIETGFLKTLSHENFLSGYAEMLKHALISSDKNWLDILAFNLDEIDYNILTSLLVTSVGIKEKIVEEDPKEKGVRKALNLGHTIGHAIESYCIETGNPVMHGYAVAWGIVCELYLSFMKLNFDKQKLIKTAHFIKENYGSFVFDCKIYDHLYELMQHDKKNENSGSINFTLLKDIGDIKINRTASKEEIFEAFDFYRELLN